MAHIITGMYTDSKAAGNAVAELKQQGFTEKIFVAALQWDDTEVKTHEIKDNGGIVGGVIGTLVGGLAGLLLGAGAIAVPGIGTLLVAGPFTALMGATGALAGGLLGFLADRGIPEDQARMYEEAIRRGEVLVAVTADHGDEERVRSVMEAHGVRETYTAHVDQ